MSSVDQETTHQTALQSLEHFVFKEVLGGDIARKAIFVLVHHLKEDKPGVLICDKNPFVETHNEISEWVSGTRLRHLASNDIYGNYEAFLPEKYNAVKTTFIYPATAKHIDKYRRQESFLIQETPEDFRDITSPYIDSLPKSNLNWVYNFIDGKAEVERILLTDSDPNVGFVLGMDLKWAGENVDNLYMQAVVCRRDLRSIRDLTNDHLSLLENIRSKVLAFVRERYGLHSNQTLMYFHYQPTYYHLHVHVINIKYEALGHGSTSVFLDTVIANLHLDGHYYCKATLPFFYKRSLLLYEAFHVAGRL